MFRLSVTRLVRVASAAGATAALAVSLAGGAGTTPVLADNGAGVIAIEGTASLPAFPGSGFGSFGGSAVGVTTANGVQPQVLAGASSAFSYSEPCVAGVGLAPANGTANGTITISGQSEYFFWNRVGLVAILALGDVPITGPGGLTNTTGAAAALFVPTGVPSATCPGSPINALVAGAGAWT